MQPKKSEIIVFKMSSTNPPAIAVDVLRENNITEDATQLARLTTLETAKTIPSLPGSRMPANRTSVMHPSTKVDGTNANASARAGDFVFGSAGAPFIGTFFYPALQSAKPE